MKLLILLATFARADGNDKTKARDAHISYMEKTCAKYIAAAPDPDIHDIKKIISTLRDYWPKQDAVVASVNDFAASCAAFQTKPNTTNDVASAGHNAVQANVKARDALQIRKRLTAFYEYYSNSKAGNTLENRTCGKFYDLAGQDIRDSESESAAAIANGCQMPLPAPAKRK